LEDTYGNPVSGSITMGVTTGPTGAVFVGSTNPVAAGASGIATFSNLILDAAGNYTITASDGSIHSLASTSFTVNPKAASAIIVWGGNGQSAAVSTSFASPLSALVTDSFGNPVSGATVTFTKPGSAASGTFLAMTPGGTCLAVGGGGTAQTSCTATTNAAGIAQSITYTANGTNGADNPTASIAGPPVVTATFSETNTKGTLIFITGLQTFATTTTNAGISSGSVIVQAQDGNGNPVVQTSALPLNLTYTNSSGTYTLTTDPAAVSIPLGASSVAFTIVASTSTGGSFTLAAANAAYVPATQVDTVQANVTTPTDTITIVNPVTTVTPTTTSATFSITVKNTSGGTLHYAISSVNGLLTTESASNPTGCVSIAKNGTQTFNELVAADEDSTPPPSRPVGTGTYVLGFNVQSYTNAACTAGIVNSEINGTLKVGLGSATTIAIAGGDGQFTPNGTAFTTPLTAFVTDNDGNAISGVTVTFTAQGSAANGTFLALSSGGTCMASGGIAVTSCTAVTNSSGVASTLSFTANSTAGNYEVLVTAPTTAPNPLYFFEDNT
jgi:adhesin/invasin